MNFSFLAMINKAVDHLVNKDFTAIMILIEAGDLISSLVYRVHFDNLIVNTN